MSTDDDDKSIISNDESWPLKSSNLEEEKLIEKNAAIIEPGMPTTVVFRNACVF